MCGNTSCILLFMAIWSNYVCLNDRVFNPYQQSERRILSFVLFIYSMSVTSPEDLLGSSSSMSFLSASSFSKRNPAPKPATPQQSVGITEVHANNDGLSESEVIIEPEATIVSEDDGYDAHNQHADKASLNSSPLPNDGAVDSPKQGSVDQVNVAKRDGSGGFSRKNSSQQPIRKVVPLSCNDE